MQDLNMNVLVAAATGILIVVMVVAIGTLILGEFNVVSKEKTIVTNETSAALSTGTQAILTANDNWVVAYNETVYLVNSSVVHAGNRVSAALVRDVNYTVTSTTDGQITGKYLRNASNSAPDANGYYIFVVTYKYYADTDATDVVSAGIDALQTLSDWFGIVALVVVAAFVIIVVTSTFGGKTGNE